MTEQRILVDQAPSLPGYEEWMTGLGKELGQLAINPDMPISGAFAAATVASLRVSAVQAQMMRFYSVNRDRTPPEALRMLRASAATQLDDRPGYRYPDDYTTARSWLDGIRWIYNTFPYGQRYNTALTKWDLSTPVSQRYVAELLIGNVLGHLVGSNPRRLDVGSSDNTGNARALLAGEQPRFAFEQLEFLRKVGRTLVSEVDRADILNAIIRRGSAAGRVVGTDKIDPSDPIMRKWIRLCLTPEELLKGDVSSMHSDLVSARDSLARDRLGFHQVDITQPRAVEALLEAEGGQFDVVSSVVSWYQGSARQRRLKFRAITERLVKPGGIAYFVDFARRQSGRREQLTPLRSWSELNVLVVHGGTIHRVAAFTDGRARKIRVTPELAGLAKGGPLEREVEAILA